VVPKGATEKAQQSRPPYRMSAMRNGLFFDIETCSALDLRMVGSNIYARHPTTDVRCVSYCLVTDGVRGPIETMTPPQPVPETIIDIANDPNIPTWAFNDAFDRQIWQYILSPRYGWPIISLARHRCAQAAALARALPASLDAAAAALKIPIRKSANGVAMMRRLAKPRSISAPRPTSSRCWRTTAAPMCG
jgi:DNA polymerase